MLDIIQVPVLSDNYIYLLHEPISGETAVVDPALSEPILNLLKKNGWQLNYVFNTHHHADHVGGNLELKQKTACKIVGAKADRHRIPGIDIELSEGDQVQLGSISFVIIATPGHTLGHIVFYCAEQAVLFCGDTLFSLGCGRLFEGSSVQMWQSLQKLKALPAPTKVYCAHEYTLANGQFALSIESDNTALNQRMLEVQALRNRNLSSLPSTIELELATNPFFRENSQSLRQSIQAQTEEPDSAVFAKIRKLKDQFR